jgi:hypothetical protein
MLICMKRFATVLEWLNHSHRSPESESPVVASAVVSFVSFVFIYWLDGRDVSSLGLWWAETLIYAFIPVLLAFIVLYRSSWHQEMRSSARAALMAILSCLIFPGALIAAGIAFFLAVLAYYCYFDRPSAFHY